MSERIRHQNKRASKSSYNKFPEYVAMANRRGIVSVRRSVDEISFPLITKILNSLNNELEGCARLYSPQDCGVTVVGFKRYTKQICTEGPNTRSISEKIQTSHRTLEVALGSIALYGQKYSLQGSTRNKLVCAKLAIEIKSDELTEEEIQYSEEYKNQGFSLQKPRDDFSPHMSIGTAYAYVEEFTDNRSINKLNRISGLGENSGKTIYLSPILNDQKCTEVVSDYKVG